MSDIGPFVAGIVVGAMAGWTVVFAMFIWILQKLNGRHWQ